MALGRNISVSEASRPKLPRHAKLKFDAHGELHKDPQYGWGIRLNFDQERDKTGKKS